MAELLIRPAAAQDCVLILALLRELAAYEKLLDIFVTDEAAIARDFFGARPLAQCDLGFEGDMAVGLVTYFWTYGSFTTKRGLFVEDLFVRPVFRGRGHGKALLRHLAAKGADRLEWRVLDWNESALAFYRGLGAEPVAGWQDWRLEGDAVKALAA